jgi:hypothetical protein
MATKKVFTHLHSCHEKMLDLGEKLGLTGEALNYFGYTLYEVTFELDVDLETGESKVVGIHL